MTPPIRWARPPGLLSAVLLALACAGCDDGAGPAKLAMDAQPAPPDQAVSADAAATDPIDAAVDAEAPDQGPEDAGLAEVDAAPPAPDCVPDATYFAETTWPGVLATRCVSCHTADGLAGDSGFRLQRLDVPGAMASNHAVVRDLGLLDRAGVPLLVAKPTGQAPHGGGAVLEADAPEVALLREAVQRARHPSECEPAPPPDQLALEGLRLLGPEATLRKAALFLTDRALTPAELDAAGRDGWGAVEAAVDRMLYEAAFYDRLRVLFNDLLLTDKYLPNREAVNLLETSHYPDARWMFEEDAILRAGGDPVLLAEAQRHTNRSLARAPIELMVRIVAEGRPFTEILTAQHVLANPYVARVYGVWDAPFDDPLDPAEWRPLQVPGIPHAGILTDPMFLNRYPTTATNRNRARARIVYLYFLGVDLLATQGRPLDATSPVHNPTLNDPQCTVCHAPMDPVAGAFQHFNARGSRTVLEAWHGDMLAPGFGGAILPPAQRTESLRWLGAQIAADPRFDRAVVGWILRGLTGEALRDAPAADATLAERAAWATQRQWIDRVAQEFRLNGHDLRDVVKAVIRSPWFRAAGVAGAAEPDPAVAAFGDPRPLTPEALALRIQAATGLPWRRRPVDADYLLDRAQYLTLFGGIDSDGVIDRLTGYNAIMGAIQWRMANEVSCVSVPQDLARPPEARRLLPFVEVGTTLVEDPAGVRATAQHLHAQLLNEVLADDDPALAQTVALFDEVQADGAAAVAAGEAPRDLPWVCRARNDWWTGRPLEDRAVARDDAYTVRAWTAVVTALLADPRFVFP